MSGAHQQQSMSRPEAMSQCIVAFFKRRELLGWADPGLATFQRNAATQRLPCRHGVVGIFHPTKVLCIELLNRQFQPATTRQPPFFVILGADAVVGQINLWAVEFPGEQARDQVFFHATARYAAHLRAVRAEGYQRAHGSGRRANGGDHGHQPRFFALGQRCRQAAENRLVSGIHGSSFSGHGVSESAFYLVGASRSDMGANRSGMCVERTSASRR